MEKPLLNDSSTPPTEKILSDILGKSFPAYSKIIDELTGEGYNFSYEWRYYNDGKSWLCKFQFRKKTVFWLSAWEGYFLVSFYFAERHCAGVADLDINPELKSTFLASKSSGTLHPLSMKIYGEEGRHDLLKVAGYKIKLK